MYDFEAPNFLVVRSRMMIKWSTISIPLQHTIDETFWDAFVFEMGKEFAQSTLVQARLSWSQGKTVGGGEGTASVIKDVPMAIDLPSWSSPRFFLVDGNTLCFLATDCILVFMIV
uniref:Uncharacterized protein n=1 Tax=Romanomermis culicivorax TaxID=13658 RepID=A0A915IU37_ROMCU